jgi:hypothetical protein
MVRLGRWNRVPKDKLKSAAAAALKDIINFTDRLLKAVSSEEAP